jgi:hypothetical protein
VFTSTIGSTTLFTAAGTGASSSSLASSLSSNSTARISPSISSTPSPDASSSGLSKGAKIGVGVGLPLGIIALLALVFLVRRFRIQITPRQKPSQTYPEAGVPTASKIADLEIAELPDSTHPPTLARSLPELHGNDSRSELPALDKKAELPGDEKITTSST